MLKHARLAAVVLAILAVQSPPASGATETYGEQLGSHTMLYLNSTPEQQRALFRATAEAGIGSLRMDFAIGQVFPRGGRDFSAVDRVNGLAAEYDVEVLGVISTTPWYMGDCPPGIDDRNAERCAPAPQYERRWRRMLGKLARRASNVHGWELGNEPDGFGFAAGPREYARWAALAAAGIRDAQPNATIAIGGFAHFTNESFVAQALNDPVYPLLPLIDVANVHLRERLGALGPTIAAARALFHRHGFDGPLWVTETGYPSRPEHQREPGFQGGMRDQARWLSHAVRALVAAGTDRVFATFRDTREFGPDSVFASEGVLRWPRLDSAGRARPKPAFWTLRRLARKPCRC
jgi:hypothetical protein